jgi:hypothetical protein
VVAPPTRAPWRWSACGAGRPSATSETATELERELAPRCRIRRQWEAEHAPVRERAAELRTELAARREHHVERSAIPP